MLYGHSLSGDDSIIYIATRLYNYADKLLAEYLEAAVIRGVERALPQIHSSRHTPFTFVPFRDTDEAKIRDPNKAKILFDEDKRRLERLFAIIGFYDGLSKDEGVSFEIGYAFARRAPIILVLTDFIRYSLKGTAVEFVLEPIIEAMTTTIIRHYDLPPGHSFQNSLLEGLRSVFSRVEEELFQLCEHPQGWTLPNAMPRYQRSVRTFERRVYIDFGGGLYEWQRRMQHELQVQLGGVTGVEVRTSGRYCDPMDPNLAHAVVRSGSDKAAIQRGYDDLLAAVEADIIVLCMDCDEASPGVAAIQGVAAAQNQVIVMYDSRTTDCLSDDGLRMSRNLMLDQSASIIVTSFDAIADAVIGAVGALR